jgi:hypothetical protein
VSDMASRGVARSMTVMWRMLIPIEILTPTPITPQETPSKAERMGTAWRHAWWLMPVMPFIWPAPCMIAGRRVVVVVMVIAIMVLVVVCPAPSIEGILLTTDAALQQTN